MPDHKNRAHFGKRDKKGGYSTKPRRRKAWNEGMSTKEDNEPNNQEASTSGSKLRRQKYPTSKFQGFRLFDLELLSTAIANFSSCKNCAGTVNLQEQFTNGLGGEYVLSCHKCHKEEKFSSSKKIGQRRKTYEINTRVKLAMRMTGNGLAGLKVFCGVMDLPPPVFVGAFDKINNKILQATSDVADQSTRRAVKDEIQVLKTIKEPQEIQERRECHQEEDSEDSEDSEDTQDLYEDEEMIIDEDLPINIKVKGDGTWQKRGHKSLNGSVTVIGAETEKVIDCEVLSSHCKVCNEWQRKKGAREGPEWEAWYSTHKPKCNSNYKGSSGGMESAGMIRIFKRSVAKHNVQYTEYISDGDAKTFLNVQRAEPYGPTQNISKLECVGHVGKRFGYHMRKLKVEYKGKKLCDGKSLFGKGRLTEAWIVKLQTYYAGAIRNNPKSLNRMIRDI